MPSRRAKPCCLVTLLLALADGTVYAADSAGVPDSLGGILARVHQHAAADAWREAGWKDEPIESWLNDVTGRISKAANSLELRLPVRFADVKPSEDANAQSLRNTLVVGKGFDWPERSLSRCIVLSDGNVTAKRLEDCVVVARGVISAEGSRSSVLVAGAYVRSGTDGEVRKTEQGSLLVTPGWVQVDSINGTTICAGEGVSTGTRIEGGIFVNATLVFGGMASFSTQRRPRSVKVRNLPIGELVNHPLSEQLEVQGVVYREVIDLSDRNSPLGIAALMNQNQPRPQPTGVVLRYGGKRYVANLGEAVVNQARQPVETLAGWTLSYVNNKIAILSNAEADAIVALEDF